MTTTTYRDTILPYIETDPSYYDFVYPVKADILDSGNFTPPANGLYLKAGFGHRYFSTTTNRTDNHGGLDYWQYHTYQGQTFNNSNKTPIICMCDGYISEVINGPDSVMELTATGRSVRVTCDSTFQTLGNKIKINYRHLSSLGALATIADTAAFGTISISKGDTIGRMGASGTTTNMHLHLSTLTLHPTFGNAYVNTNRLFDPTKSPQILGPLTNAKVEYLQDWADSALFRVTWPFNQTINNFAFINQTDTVIFNKEDAYETGSALRDNHDCLPNINVYAYQFNGSQTAKFRYQNEMSNMLANYPASPHRDTNLTIYGYNHFPITHDSVAFVYDFMVKNLSPTHNTQDFKVKLSDVWGYTVEAQLQAPLAVNWLSFDVANSPEKVNLSWTTASEINNKLFVIERSDNGTDWHELDKVLSNGNSTTPSNYEYQDYTPLNGLSYYRLKQVDIDGKLSYSEIKKVIRNRQSQISIYPNPTKEFVTIQSIGAPIKELAIYNTFGNEVTNKLNVVNKTRYELKLDFTAFAKGLYLIRINSTAATESFKLLKE